jgi:hypothetical protein
MAARTSYLVTPDADAPGRENASIKAINQPIADGDADNLEKKALHVNSASFFSVWGRT